MLANFTRQGWNGPLYSPLLRGWIAVAGDAVFSMRYLSVLWALLSVAVFYVLGERIGGHGVGRWAAGLLALSPYAIWYAQEIKMYTWVPLLVLAALYGFDRACERPSARWWSVVFVATSLAFYSHILAALLIPVELGWFLLHPRRHRRAWVGAVIVVAGLIVPYIPLLAWQAPLLLQARQTGYPAYSLLEMAQVLLSAWSLGIHQAYRSAPWQSLEPLKGWNLASFIDWALVLFYTLLALVGAWLLAVRGGGRRLASVALWLAVPLLCVWGISLQGSIFTDRYLIWCAPAFYLLAGMTFRELVRHGPWVASIPTVVVVLAALSGVYGQATVAIKPQFDRAAAHLREARLPADLLLFQIPYNRHVLGYYLRPEEIDRWIDAPYTNRRLPDGSYEMDSAEVARLLQTSIGSSKRVWLVYSEVLLWDERELVRAWLEATATVADRRVYQGVELICYAFSP